MRCIFFGLCAVLMMMPAVAQAAPSWCRAPHAPQLVVTPRQDTLRYDFTKTIAQLNKVDTDTVNPYGTGVHSDTGGLMRGGIRTAYRTQMGGISYGAQGRGQSCVWIDTIKVDITLSPTIFIARDYPQGSCMFNAIKGHELKHLAVDQRLMDRYTRDIRTALAQEMQRQSTYGPFPTAQTGAVQQQIQSRIVQVMDTTMARLNADRRRQQQAVDSLEEYQRVNAMCQ